MTNPLDTIFEPFHEIDIAATYQNHGVYIDFVIYLVIFAGLSKFVFSKRFPGQAGRAITIGIAIALSTGMSVFSYQTGFRLGNLGSIAAILLLALFAVMIFVFIKQLGGQTANSGIIAFIAAYMITRAAFPEVYKWAEQAQFARWLDAAVLLAIPVLLVLVLLRNKMPWRRKNKAMDTPQDAAAKQTGQEELKGLQTGNQIERQAYKQDKNAVRQEKAIVRDIDSIIAILRKEGVTPQTATKIRSILTDLQREDDELGRTLSQLKLISEKLQQWDIHSFQTLSQLYQRLPAEKQKRLKEAIQAEQATIMQNKTIQEAEQRITQLRQAYQNQLSLAVNAIGHRNTTEAINRLQQARRIQQDSQTLLSQLKPLQKRILRLTSAEAAILEELQK